RPSISRCSTIRSTSIPRRRSRFSPPTWALAAGLPLLLGAAGGIDVVRFFLVFAIMLLAGKFAGEAFERLGQPAVMGELLAGILGGAVIDDVIGLVILSVVSGLAAGTAFSLHGALRILGVAVAFLFLALWIGLKVAPRLFGLVDRMRVRGVLVVSAFAFLLLLCVLAERAGTALIIGAFAAGLILSETKQFGAIEERIKPVADIFTPIFFLSIGAAVDPRVWNPFVPESHQTLAIGGTLFAIAVLGKFASGWAVPWRRFNRPAVGVGMAPRGEVGLIFAQIGLAAGILSNRVFSAI